MVKKPRLALVDQSTVTSMAAPAGLNKTGATLWRSIMSEYDIHDSGGLEILRQACEAADRVQKFSSVIERDGPMIRTKHGPKDHPLLKHELMARSFVVRSLHRLGLDVEPIKSVGRPGIWANPDGNE
jgi:hypothetical protein